MLPENKSGYAVLGLSNGDEGKGTIVDWLARNTNIKTVVRYGGAHQAAHNVVLPSGIHHCFSQFGSGSLAGCDTILCGDMAINPISLEVEAEVLAVKINRNPYDTISVFPDLTIIAPYHKVYGQMLEISRGAKKHSSCGKGVGQAIKWRDLDEMYNLTVGDFQKADGTVSQKIELSLSRAKDLAYKLVLEGCVPTMNTDKEYDSVRIRKLWGSLLDDEYKYVIEKALRKCLKNLSVCKNLQEDKPYIFEGSQGVLLDFEHGFYPHVTKSRIRFPDRKGVYRIGVIRSYQTRHGNGLFVTEDDSLDDCFEELHNVENEWQGKMRKGWLDLVSVRYAINVAGGIDALAVTHLDCLGNVPVVKVCNRYLCNLNVDDFMKDNFVLEFVNNHVYVVNIIVKERTENERLRLVRYLKSFVPQYVEMNHSADKLIRFIEDQVAVRVKFVSYGRTHNDVMAL